MKKYIRNPFNYIGSKDRILPLIEKHLDFNCKYLVEPFAGSSIVSVNFGDKFDKVYANDNCWQLIETIKEIRNNQNFEADADTWVENFDLSKQNKDGYLEARKYFNTFYNTKDSFDASLFYALVTHSYNYMIHINSKQEFNTPSGAGRSYFNSSLRAKLNEYSQKLKTIDYEASSYLCDDFIDYIMAGEDGDLSKYMFFVDPPYLISDDAYSYTHGNKWSEQLEIKLYETLDMISGCGGKFLLTNFIQKNDKTNEHLLTFCKKYEIIDVEIDYTNCNHQRKNKGKTKEILVKN